MDKEIIDKIMFDNFLKSVPTMVVDVKDRKTISAYGSIDVDDLRSVIDTFKKVPEYGELLKKVKEQKEVIDKIKSLIKSKDNGICIQNNEEKGAYTFVLNFDEARKFIWDLEDILKEVSE